MLIGVLAAAGSIVTLFACVRMVMAVRSQQPREVVVGWFTIMLAAPIIVFAIDRVA